MSKDQIMSVEDYFQLDRNSPDARYEYSVSCDSEDQERGDMLFSPCLIVEVLSPSTERYDRGRKMLYYRECPTVREYVMIDSLRPCIEMFRWERVNLWTHYVFRSGDEVELSSLSLRFPLAKIYRNVAFPEQDDIFE